VRVVLHDVEAERGHGGGRGQLLADGGGHDPARRLAHAVLGGGGVDRGVEMQLGEHRVQLGLRRGHRRLVARRGEGVRAQTPPRRDQLVPETARVAGHDQVLARQVLEDLQEEVVGELEGELLETGIGIGRHAQRSAEGVMT